MLTLKYESNQSKLSKLQSYDWRLEKLPFVVTPKKDILVMKPNCWIATLALQLAYVRSADMVTTLSSVEDGVCSEVTLNAAHAADTVVQLGGTGFLEATCESFGYTSPAGSKNFATTSLNEITMELYTKPAGDNSEITLSSGSSSNNRGSSSSSSTKVVPAGGGHGWVDGVLISWMGPFACYETTYIKTEWDLLHKQANANWIKRYLHSCEERMYTIYQTETVEVFPKIKKHMVVKKYLLDPKQYIRQTGSGSITGGSGATSVHMLTAENDPDAYGVPEFMMTE